MRRFRVTRRGARVAVELDAGALDLSGAEAMLLARDLQQAASGAALEVARNVTVVDAAKALGALVSHVQQQRRRARRR